MRNQSFGFLVSMMFSAAACSSVSGETTGEEGGAGAGDQGSSGAGDEGGSGAGDEGGSAGVGGESGDPARVAELDLLLVIDNSIGMQPAQAQFARELDTLLRYLTDPPCLTATSKVLAADGQCPAGSKRPFAPVRSIHLGVISSSLGSLASDACETVTNPDDQGRLLRRAVDGGSVPTYQDMGFLAFDADSQMSPPGEASVEAFVSRAQALVMGASDEGCGYEMPLESMTRFLVDPAPYAWINADSGTMVPEGVDEVVLEQRANFLRDTSNLAVVVLSNENDCSIDARSQGHLLLDSGPFYRATSTCETAPDDPCCTSCALNVDPACDPGLSCSADPNGNRYDDADDPANLACFDQKRRYGIDFLYPTERYVNALSALSIDPTSSTLSGTSEVANPLFAGGRRVGQISFQAIVGVPWQDVLIDPKNESTRVLRAAEMEEQSQWEWIVGEEPSDPFARESVAIREGENPAMGADVDRKNIINGGDRTVSDALQYACITPLPEPIVDSWRCAQCSDLGCDDPTCDGSTQVAAGATPGSRELEVVRGLGSRGAMGSICLDPSLAGSAKALVIRLSDVLP